MSGKIIIYLTGGLGNQMFQYAFGRRLSLKNSLPLVLDVSFFRNDSRYKRNFGLSSFYIDSIVKERRSFTDRFIRKLRLGSPFRKIIGEPELFKDSVGYEEKLSRGAPVNGFNRDVLNTRLTKPTEFRGYWQSEEYFLEISDVIRKDFILKKSLSDSGRENAKKIVDTNAVCIGVRRYNEGGKSSPHFKLSSDYYSSAIKIIEEKIDNPTFFLFTLDTQWAKENIKTSCPLFFINGPNTNIFPQEELYLMSQCKHFIIPNSTFHWWGAWLSPNREKIVVAPQKGWANEKPVPAQWIQI